MAKRACISRRDRVCARKARESRAPTPCQLNVVVPTVLNMAIWASNPAGEAARRVSLVGFSSRPKRGVVVA